MHAPKQDTNANTELHLKQQTATAKRVPEAQDIPSSQDDLLVRHISRMGNSPNPSAHAAILNRAPANQQSSNQQLLLQWQQQYGNPYVNQVLQLARQTRQETSATTTQKPVVQAKMTINPVGDKYEQEADRVAHQVVQRLNAPAVGQSGQGQAIQREAVPEAETVQKKPEISAIQRQELSEEEKLIYTKQDKKCDQCEEEEKLAAQEPESATKKLHKPSLKEDKGELVQMKSSAQQKSGKDGMAATPELEASIQQSRGKGEPLADEIRKPLEQAFGADFSGVRIHAESQSNQFNESIQARAFTIGQDIFFRQGEYTPGSKQGQELLAHELTHVVQQNVSVVQPTTQPEEQPQFGATQAANPVGQKTDSANTAGVEVTEPSHSLGIQRLCSKCDQEKETVQTKELPGRTLGVVPDSEALSISVPEQTIQRAVTDESIEYKNKQIAHENSSDSPPKAPELSQQNQGQPQPQETLFSLGDVGCNQPVEDPCKAQAEAQKNTAQPDISGCLKSCGIEPGEQKQEQPAQSNQPSCAPKSEQANNCSQPPQSEQSSGCGQSSSTNTQGANPCNLGEQEAQKQQPEGEQNPEKADKGDEEALEEAPEAQAFEEAATVEDALDLNPEGSGEVANSKVAAEKEPAATTSTQTQAQLDAINADATQLAAKRINFVLPKQEETDKNEDAASLEQQRVVANKIANSFMVEAAGQVQTITQLGQGIQARIQGAAENAKASIMGTVEEQKAAVTEAIAQHRSQVQNEAQATIAHIQTQYQATVVSISQTTATARQQVEAGFASVVQTLNERQTSHIAWTNLLYFHTSKRYRKAGVDAGNAATAKGEELAEPWSVQAEDKRPVKLQDRLEPVRNHENAARATAARQVACQYKCSLQAEADQQASNLQKGKQKDIKAIECGVEEFRKCLQSQQQGVVKSLSDIEQDTLSVAKKAQTKRTEVVNRTLQATLKSLDQQEAAQLQLLTAYGERQALAIEHDSQKAIALLQNGVKEAGANLLETLQTLRSRLQGTQAPNPEELGVVIAEMLGQFDAAVAAVQGHTEQGIVNSRQGIAQREQEAVGAVAEMARMGLEESATVVEAAKSDLAQLNQGATDAFNQIREHHATAAIEKIAEPTVGNLGEVIHNIQACFFDVLSGKQQETLDKTVTELETALRQTVDKCLEADIRKAAEEAAKQARKDYWNTLWKGLLLAGVTVLAAAVAPAIIGALIGFFGGVLGTGIVATALGVVVGGAIIGTAAGVLNQIGNNLIDGKKWNEDLDKAAIMGVVGGAIGGAGGGLGRALGMLSKAGKLGKVGSTLAQKLSKTPQRQFAAELLGDIPFDIAGNIAGLKAVGEELKGEDIPMDALMEMVINASTMKLGSRSLYRKSEKIGAKLGSELRSVFGSKANLSTVKQSGDRTIENISTTSRTSESQRPTGEHETPAPQEANRRVDTSDTPSESVSARERSVQESGFIESDELSLQQIKNEEDHISKHPEIVEGTAPNRRAEIGKHKWIEEENGTACRHSLHPLCSNNAFESQKSQNWLNEWYKKPINTKNSTAQRKFAQLINNLIDDNQTHLEWSAKIQQINWAEINDSLFSTILSFHMHIAPYIVNNNQGLDRNTLAKYVGTYFRSNVHLYKEIYKRVAKLVYSNHDQHFLPSLQAENITINPPYNIQYLQKLWSIALMNNVKPSINEIKYNPNLNLFFDKKTILPVQRSAFASLAITHNNFTLLQRIKNLMPYLPNQDASIILEQENGQEKVYDKKGKIIPEKSLQIELEKILNELSEKVQRSTKENYHDYLLSERGQVAEELGKLINTEINSYHAIGAKGHPSLIVNNVLTDKKADDADVNKFLQELNASEGTDIWKIFTTKRGSFGFPRPTVSPVGNSLRLWLGFAPKEALIENIMKAIQPDKEYQRQQGNSIEGGGVRPRPASIHVEALKTAVRHTIIVYRNRLGKPTQPTRLDRWLNTRLVSYLTRANYLLDLYNNYKTPLNMNQHYLKTAQVIEKLLEYTFLYTATSPPASRLDAYENHLKTTLLRQGQAYQVFYLDSGMQALNTAIILARRFRASQKNVPEPTKMKLESIKSYFELDDNVMRALSIYKQGITQELATENIVAADLSPAITNLDDSGKQWSKFEQLSELDHQQAIRAKVNPDTIAIIDITNAPLSKVDAMIRMNHQQGWAENYILVESLTKHQQIGADKFIMGRLIVVGSKAFMQKAETIVKPIEDEAHVPILQEFRRNLDEAIYGEDISLIWLLHEKNTLS